VKAARGPAQIDGNYLKSMTPASAEQKNGMSSGSRALDGRGAAGRRAIVGAQNDFVNQKPWKQEQRIVPREKMGLTRHLTKGKAFRSRKMS